MLSSGKALWGFANDDFHDIYEMNVGWTMIYAASDAFEDVKTAVKRGSLYASNGLRLYDFSFDGNILKVTADYPFYRTRRIAYKFIGKGGKLLKEEFGSEGTYCPKGNEEYIRVQATGEDGSMLWCQPLLNSFFFK